ncbi:MAG: hypothetical protein A2474_03335 [Elusimicrobia bacterium RIFOXYC2_FULL_34_12]|nr:MAG: hypothetical protein A2474_03335 [Elusimicrobia bacterium RIFOXYC2_FULL_34_12]
MVQDRKEVIGAVNTITYGLYVITSIGNENKVNGQISNTVFQITSVPLRIALGINKKNYTYELIKESGVFAINILKQSQLSMIPIFGLKSGRDINKFENIKYHTEITNSPIFDDILSWMDCRVIKDMTIDCGTHSLFIADVLDGSIVSVEEPLTYKYYRENRTK